jgi:hypothetical protein
LNLNKLAVIGFSFPGYAPVIATNGKRNIEKIKQIPVTIAVSPIPPPITYFKPGLMEFISISVPSKCFEYSPKAGNISWTV